ncbi:MAG: 16S rRNA (cytosine(1402)-N(4))-methyltransferase RsmH [Candidatus Portnoybacteria bacterium]|nr:16S rRNA (cytosine(1402)-N(4))-methyltransferase RsmH [Candidatus Portnoybacteria bacterium]MDD4983046.1 16S rRNA (cytosine(1402)-N(4))-methyltransferase RsmH [Candidatus Portnoybacteria bacterium]
MHIPVLLQEVIEYLNPVADENFIDGTGGAAGHTLATLEKNAPGGKILFFDRDAEAITRAKETIAAKGLSGRMIFANDTYANIAQAVKENNFAPVHGILLDLGLSSDQLEAGGRGFSFMKDEPLDMRYGANQELTAREIINHWENKEIENILKEYGEEPFARRISEQIIKSRKIKSILSTKELVGVIAEAVPKKFQYGRIHFATRTFQALRITVNDELGNLKRFLPQAIDVLKEGGRLAIISFHSLEDRIVKNFFRDLAKAGRAELLTKKPITAGEDEIHVNPRSRSAKLRVIKKIE